MQMAMSTLLLAMRLIACALSSARATTLSIISAKNRSASLMPKKQRLTASETKGADGDQ
jgi:hypothetical protein